VIHPEGAAQVALVGPPNAGKSSLHARLTGSAAHVGPDHRVADGDIVELHA
jgi:ribosome-interacting GTPase 1